jgi:hypothetical protein
MLLASYVSTRDGLIGLGNIGIRLRTCDLKQAFILEGTPGDRTPRASHSELVFVPEDGDDVRELMPDKSLEPDENGAFWCLSSTGFDHIPDWAPRRQGKMGGVRFKRINVKNHKWRLDEVNRDPYQAALWGRENEGRPYDWQLVIGKAAVLTQILLPNSDSRLMCNECILTAIGVENPRLFDPASTEALVRAL